MRITRHVKEWWFEPNITKAKLRVSKSLMQTDPTKDFENKFPYQSRVGRFEHSRKWVRYNRLHGIDTGYIVPLYPLSDIALRFGLSDNGQRYFRKYILPEPFDIVRRRSVNAHHWPLFVLMALDTVLRDLERRGFNRFDRSYEDHIKLLHDGAAYMQNHYTQKAESLLMDTSDKFGVQWLT